MGVEAPTRQGARNAHAGRMQATSNAARRDASVVMVAVLFRPEPLDQPDCSRESNALATGGASFGTWADQEFVFTGTMVSMPDGLAVRRCSAMARPRSPTGATTGPMRKTQRSRCSSVFARAASAQLSRSVTASTVSTKRPRIRGGACG